MRAAATGLLIVLILSGSAAGLDYRQLAELYAPVWYVDTGDNERGDFITSYDFDGDRRADNNWEHIDASDLKAVTYYSVTETATHYFIHYLIYWAQDWLWPANLDGFSHENDMEGALVVVTKQDPLTEPLLVVTTAELNIFHWSSSPDVSEGDRDLDGDVLLENGSHPRIYAAQQSHQVVLEDVWVVIGSYVGQAGSDFPGDDGVVYRYTGTPEEPSSDNDRDVGYDLVSLVDDLWPEVLGPYGAGRLLDCGAQYIGRRFTVPDYWGMCFDGDTFDDDAASAPWGLDAESDDMEQGDWLADPAELVWVDLDIQGDYSRNYLFNPYLASIAPKITSIAATQAWLDTPYHYDEDDKAAASGSQPIEWELIEGPDDFELDAGSGLISWTPERAGDFDVTIRAWSAAGRDDQSFSINVSTDDPPSDDDDDSGDDDDDSGGRSADDGGGCCG